MRLADFVFLQSKLSRRDLGCLLLEIGPADIWSDRRHLRSPGRPRRQTPPTSTWDGFLAFLQLPWLGDRQELCLFPLMSFSPLGACCLPGILRGRCEDETRWSVGTSLPGEGSSVLSTQMVLSCGGAFPHFLRGSWQLHRGGKHQGGKRAANQQRQDGDSGLPDSRRCSYHMRCLRFSICGRRAVLPGG